MSMRLTVCALLLCLSSAPLSGQAGSATTTGPAGTAAPAAQLPSPAPAASAPQPASGQTVASSTPAPVAPNVPGGLVQVPIRDITSIEGIRDNLLVGYGLVVGLSGTGDRQQTLFTTQTLANVLQKMGVQVAPQQMLVNNVAAVFVTATLPPFARPGMRIAVTVSSTGDARSLAGGTLLLTPLKGPDGQTYAEAQGPLTVGGFNAGTAGNSVSVNQTNVGIIPSGGIVERDTAVDLSQFTKLSFLLRDPDFSTARSIAETINRNVGSPVARVIDSRRIDVVPPRNGDIPDFLATIENLSVMVNPPARVVIDERTGTVVVGNNVKLGPISIVHGDLAVEISTKYAVSQPGAFSGNNAQTVVVPQTTVNTQESQVSHLSLAAGSSVEQLVEGLQQLGATPRDIVGILQAIKASGALQAQLEVI